MSKKESAKSIIPPALIIIFSYRDIGFAKEIETNMQTYVKTTYLKNISKEENKAELTTHIKNIFFIRYYRIKTFLNTIFMRVMLLYAILFVPTSIIPINGIKEFYRKITENKESLLFTIFFIHKYY